MINKKHFKYRKEIILIGILLTISGAFLAYFKWGIEPQETIAGALCGVGFSLIIFTLGVKKPKEL